MPEISNITSFSELNKYLQQIGVPRTESRSFIRLVKDSEYNGFSEFVFTTCHSHYTEPRLRKLRQAGLIYWVPASCDQYLLYQKDYIWTLLKGTKEMGDLLVRLRDR